jgi:hypothetical protein
MTDTTAAPKPLGLRLRFGREVELETGVPL